MADLTLDQFRTMRWPDQREVIHWVHAQGFNDLSVIEVTVIDDDPLTARLICRDPADPANKTIELTRRITSRPPVPA